MKKLLTLTALALTMLLIVKADVVKNYITGEVPSKDGVTTEQTAPQKATAQSRSTSGYVNILSNGNASRDWDNPTMLDTDPNFASVCAWAVENQVDVHPCDITTVDGNRVFVVHAGDKIEEDWDNMFMITAPHPFAAGDVFRISFRMKAAHDARTRTMAFKEPTAYVHWSCMGDVEFTTDWTELERTVTVSESMNGMQSITFCLSYNDNTANDYYIDDIRWEVDNTPENAAKEIESMITKSSSVDIAVTNSTQYPWSMVEGEFRPGNIGVHSSNSSFNVAINCAEEGCLTFDWSIESESSCDYLYYEIDGQSNQISGYSPDWRNVNIPLTVGEHNLTIGYRKDGSVNSYRDYGSVKSMIISTLDDYDNLMARNDLLKVIKEAYPLGYSTEAAYQLYLEATASIAALNEAKTALENAMAANEMTIQRRDNLTLFEAVATIEQIQSEMDADVLESIPFDYASFDNALECSASVTSIYADATPEVLDTVCEILASFMASATEIVVPIMHVNEDNAVYVVDLSYAVPGFEIKYSINGADVKDYVEPFVIAETATIDAYAIFHGSRSVTVSNEVAVDYVVVHVDQPGLFARRMLEKVENFNDIVRLKVTGTLSDDDYAYFRNSLNNLACVDLSELNAEYMPGDVFYGSRIQSVKLPANLKTVSYECLRGCENLKEIVIPEGVTMIDNYAFYNCTNLWNVELPNSLNTIGSQAFTYCPALKDIKLPEGLVEIKSSAFSNCENLNNIELPSTVTTIGSTAFYNCRSFTSIKLPDSLTSLGSRVFDCCYNLRHVELPSSLTYLPYALFSSCSSLTSVNIKEGIQTISSGVFSGTQLTEIELPSTLIQVEGEFLPQTVKKIVCKAACVPYGDYNIYPYNYKSTCDLYVPAVAMTEYKINPYWSGYRHILPIAGYNPDVINVNKETYITADTRVPNKPAVNIQYIDGERIGSLIVEGTDTLSMTSFTMEHNDYSRQYWGSYNAHNLYYTSLINSRYMRADEISIARRIYGGYWVFLSMPYDVKVSEITNSAAAAGEDLQWVVRRYNGANRAAGLTPTWENVEYTDTLRAGEGFILMHNGTGYYTYDDNGNSTYHDTQNTTFNFPALNTANKQNIFAADDVTVALAEYSGDEVYAHNRSWNLIANPYPCCYDVRFIDFSAPVTLWRNNRYVAYSPLDDELILAPNEPIFVQRPVDQAAIKFAAEGRQKDCNVRSLSAPQRIAGDQSQRDVFNLLLSQGENSDNARFVINEAATLDYEMSRDAAKFFADDAAMHIYTVNDGVQYAINERPLSDASVTLGVRFAQGGQYTIALNTKSDMEITLIDHLLGIQTDLQASDYTFSTEAGIYDGRFEIIVGSATTAISAISADSLRDAQYYTISGVKLQGAPTAKGVYIMVINGVSRKVSVK